MRVSTRGRQIKMGRGQGPESILSVVMDTGCYFCRKEVKSKKNQDLVSYHIRKSTRTNRANSASYAVFRTN